MPLPSDYAARRQGGAMAGFAPLGERHFVRDFRRGSTLLVTFDRFDPVRADEIPMSWQVAEAKEWSHLALIAPQSQWFRHGAVRRFFEAKVLEDYFDDFETVIFFGAGAGPGHAAASYCATAPEARVLALSPAATMAGRHAIWDRRDLSARREDFASRFGYAPDYIAAARQAVLLFDPEVDEDAMHAALFEGSGALRLEARHLGPHPGHVLTDLGLIGPLLGALAEDRFDTETWRALWRQRRAQSPAWTRNIAARLADGPSRLLEAMFLRAQAPRYAKALPRLTLRLEAVQAEIEAEGLAVPSPRRR